MKTRLAVLATGLIIGISLPAFAGIQADVTIKTFDGKKIKETENGKFFSQDQKVLVEHTRQAAKKVAKAPVKKDDKAASARKEREPVKQAFIVDQSTSKGTVILHYHKKFMEVDLSMARSWEQNWWKRFMTEGGIALNPEEFKKRRYDLKMVKEEKVQGHPCKVWKAQRELGGQVEIINIWTAKDLGDTPIKIVVKQGEETKSEFLLSNIKQAPLEATMFNHPADYAQYQPKIMVGEMPKKDGKKGGAKRAKAPQKT